MASIKIGVDLVPIKAIKGCMTFTADITTTRCVNLVTIILISLTHNIFRLKRNLNISKQMWYCMMVRQMWEQSGQKTLTINLSCVCIL